MSECWKVGIKVSGALSLDESDLANSRERSETQTHLICNEFVPGEIRRLQERRTINLSSSLWNCILSNWPASGTPSIHRIHHQLAFRTFRAKVEGLRCSKTE
jgi:hypothetical protein